MSVTPAYELSLPMQNLRTLLCNAASFRTLVGAASVAEAYRSVWYFGIDRPRAWAASTAFRYGAHVITDPDAVPSLIMKCTTAGTSGSTEPTWPTTAGGTVTDGSAVWTAVSVLGNAYNHPARALRPWAILGYTGEWRSSANAEANRAWFHSNGGLLLELEADVPAAYADTIEDAGLWFTNLVGQIVGEMKPNCAAPGYLGVYEFELADLFRTPDERLEDEGDRMHADLIVRWEGL